MSLIKLLWLELIGFKVDGLQVTLLLKLNQVVHIGHLGVEGLGSGICWPKGRYLDQT